LLEDSDIIEGVEMRPAAANKAKVPELINMLEENVIKKFYF
jgi:hypothetical protein